MASPIDRLIDAALASPRPGDTSDATDALLTVFVGPWVMAASLWMGAVMACTAPLGVAAMAVGEWRKLR